MQVRWRPLSWKKTRKLKEWDRRKNREPLLLSSPVSVSDSIHCSFSYFFFHLLTAEWCGIPLVLTVRNTLIQACPLFFLCIDVNSSFVHLIKWKHRPSFNLFPLPPLFHPITGSHTFSRRKELISEQITVPFSHLPLLPLHCPLSDYSRLSSSLHISPSTQANSSPHRPAMRLMRQCVSPSLNHSSLSLVLSHSSTRSSPSSSSFLLLNGHVF